MSAPATNDLGPEPVRMAPLMSGSVAMRSAAPASSSITRSFNAFSLSGRFTVTHAIPSRISNIKVW